MSLVNDLLIEAERRRSEARPARSLRLDDLAPALERRTSHSARTTLGTIVVTVASLGLIIAIAYHRSSALPAPTLASMASAPEAPPPVAARPAPVANPRDPGRDPALAAARRPVRVESISLERTPTSTLLRIVTDGRTAHRIEHDLASATLDLVLTATALDEPTGPLDLLDTPIRSLDLRSESPDLRLSLELDAEVHSQTRWLDLHDGAALVLELQAATTPALEAGLIDLPISIPAAESTPIESRESERPSAAAADPSPTPQRVDQTIAPDLGDPQSLRIQRSQRDRVRESRAAKRAAIAESLASARRARAEGRLEDADASFAEVVLLAPNELGALIEWSQALVALDRPAEAIALIESARARAPRDADLLITHAQLLEKKGDLRLALELLERSGLSVTESPDVHALAAAYHQRSGDHEAAIERYEQILRRFPEQPRGWMGLGISLEAVGRSNEARDVYRIALQVGELPGGTRRWVSTRLAALGKED